MASENSGFSSFLRSILTGASRSNPNRSSQDFRQVFESARWAIKTAWSSHPGLIFALSAIILSDGLFPAGMALVMRGLINGVVEATGRSSHDLAPILPWLALGLGLTVLMAVSKLFSQYLAGRLADEVDISITSKILTHAAKLDVAFYEDARNQDIIHRARQDSANHFSRFIVTTLNLISSLIQIVSLLAILVVVEPLVLRYTRGSRP